MRKPARTIETITVDDILSRTVEEGECLLWTGFASSNGKHPRLKLGGKSTGVRLALWELTRGPVPPGKYIGVKCGCDLCVHPDCLVARPKGAAMRGRPKPLDQIMRRTMTRRAKSKILTAELVREIRASDESCRKVEARLGLPRTTVSLIRRNLAWREFSSPFAGLWELRS